MWVSLLSLNQKLFLLINNFAGKSQLADKIGVFIGEGGPYFFIILICLIYFNKKKKKEAIYATITVMLAIIFNHILEHFYYHPRPFADGLGRLLSEHNPDSSFPSDHTTFMLALSWSLLMFKETSELGRKMLLLGVVFGLARVFEGVHYPFDILGGFIMGGIAAFIIYLVKDLLKPLIDLILLIDKKIFKN